MTAAAFLSLCGTVFGLLGLIGGAVAYLASMRQKTTIEVLETDNKARGERMETLEKAEGECRARLDAAMLKVSVLTDTVTNAQAVAELLARVDLQHNDLRTLAAKVDAHFVEMLAQLRGKAPA